MATVTAWEPEEKKKLEELRKLIEQGKVDEGGRKRYNVEKVLQELNKKENK